MRKVAQFRKRYSAGRSDRNAIVHSNWVFRAHTQDPDVIVGVRYKQRNRATGYVATVSLADIAGDCRQQDVVEYSLKQLRTQLRHDIATMRVGEIAYAQVMLAWAARSNEMSGLKASQTSRAD